MNSDTKVFVPSVPNVIPYDQRNVLLELLGCHHSAARLAMTPYVPDAKTIEREYLLAALGVGAYTEADLFAKFPNMMKKNSGKENREFVNKVESAKLPFLSKEIDGHMLAGISAFERVIAGFQIDGPAGESLEIEMPPVFKRKGVGYMFMASSMRTSGYFADEDDDGNQLTGWYVKYIPYAACLLGGGSEDRLQKVVIIGIGCTDVPKIRSVHFQMSGHEQNFAAVRKHIAEHLKDYAVEQKSGQFSSCDRTNCHACFDYSRHVPDDFASLKMYGLKFGLDVV